MCVNDVENKVGLSYLISTHGDIGRYAGVARHGQATHCLSVTVAIAGGTKTPPSPARGLRKLMAWALSSF